MNQSIFRRLIWKEYRLQRAFWVAMAVLGVMLMLFGWVYNNRQDELIQGLFYIALGTPVFYILGCASTTFAGEHDIGTYQFQRSLPVTASKVFWVKVSFAIISTLTMWVLFFMLAFVMAQGQLPSAELYRGNVGIWDMLTIAGAVAWLYGVWGVFFSLLIKRPLLAVILAVTVASMGPYLIAWIWQIWYLLESMAIPIASFAGFTVLVALVDIWLGLGWLKESKRPILGPKRLGKGRSTKPRTLAEYLSRPNSWNMLQRLSWQHWRQSKWVGFILLAMSAILLLAMLQLLRISILFSRNSSGSRYLGEMFDTCGLVALWMLFLVPVLGSFTFLADQRQSNFRFFAERGIHPRQVWLSRLWPWPFIVIFLFALPVVFLLMACILPWINQSQPMLGLNEWYKAFVIIGYAFGYVVLGITVGQLCSMFFRSGLLAGLFSYWITAILILWAALMQLWGINWLWSVAPIPFCLLLATWLRAPDWILERKGPRSWLWPGLALALPTILILTAVPLCRLYEIPVVNLSFTEESIFRPLDSEEQATLDLYKKALNTYSDYPKSKPTAKEEEVEIQSTEDTYYTRPEPLSADDLEWVEANQELIPLAIEASKGQEAIFSPSSRLIGSDNPAYYGWEASHIGKILILSARELEQDGKLDDAMEQYLAAVRIARQLHSCVYPSEEGDNLEFRVYDQLPFWAARNNQSAERIKKAIKELEKLTSDMPVGDTKIKFEYFSTREDLSTGLKDNGNRYTPAATFLWFKLPWEHARALRLLNVLVRRDLEDIQEAEWAARTGKAIPVVPGEEYLMHPNHDIDRNYALRKAIKVPPIEYLPESPHRIAQFADMENRRRATRIVLALQACKLERGKYPKTLDELVGPYLEKLPNDPYSGLSYRYFPTGLKLYIQYSGNFITESPIKDKPFIWSSSTRITMINPGGSDERYKIFDFEYGHYDRGHWCRSTSEYDLYSHGRFFLVP